MVLYGMAPAVGLGAACCWLRLHLMSHLSDILHGAFQERKDAALASSSSADASARAAGASVVSQMGDLKMVHRFKDEKQVSILLREMRVWDEDGVPDPEAAEFGEFVLKVGGVLLSCICLASTNSACFCCRTLFYAGMLHVSCKLVVARAGALHMFGILAATTRHCPEDELAKQPAAGATVTCQRSVVARVSTVLAACADACCYRSAPWHAWETTHCCWWCMPTS
jgi:hypothetical protein